MLVFPESIYLIIGQRQHQHRIGIHVIHCFILVCDDFSLLVDSEREEKEDSLRVTHTLRHTFIIIMSVPASDTEFQLPIPKETDGVRTVSSVKSEHVALIWGGESERRGNNCGIHEVAEITR